MKKVLVFTILCFVSLLSNSQVITVKFDTIQWFSHSYDISTPKARETNNIVYGKLMKCIKTTELTFDLDNMIERYNGFENIITKNNNSTNLVDVEVNEGGRIGLCILGKTEDGQMIYLFETIKGDMVEGYFAINPQIIQ
jgi:hypothetical protein